MILEDKQVAELFMRNQQEALQQGTEGAIQDLEVQWAPWSFCLEDIHVPVHIRVLCTKSSLNKKPLYKKVAFKIYLMQSLHASSHRFLLIHEFKPGSEPGISH